MKLLIAALLLFTWFDAEAGDERVAIESTLMDYIDGTSYNNRSQIDAAFHPGANLYLEKKDEPLWTVPISQYRSWFNTSNQGKFNGRIGEILNIDVEGTIATAKVEILIPKNHQRYIDMFLLKKLDGHWQILSKSALPSPSEQQGERILFIVSSAYFHGDSNLPAGASFSEIVNAYHAFKKAGFTVDFVSPEGGAIPLAYINTSEPLHRQYLYDPDFMYAIGHTKAPMNVKPERYRAVHYIGGSNAMYGVADNAAIGRIAMTIYEQYDGIISSVCHGTAGIVNLKTKEGEYLVSGKRISGYPESFENQTRAYFKQFPFLIQKTIEAHGGQFLHSERNTAHVEVDGRIVTGQNHLSSALVAERIIEMLQNSFTGANYLPTVVQPLAAANNQGLYVDAEIQNGTSL